VPTNGSLASRQAAELAFRLADENDVVVILNVVRTSEDPHRAIRRGEEHRFATAEAIVRDLAAIGEAQGVRVLPMVRVGTEADEVILSVAADIGCGLCVMGTDVRAGSDRLFLGPRVEQILDGASCPVLVFNAT
jgi:nucleotide-binding universal stress UspA family protein